MHTSSIPEIAPTDRHLLDEVVRFVARELESSYLPAERDCFQFRPWDDSILGLRIGSGSASWPAVDLVMTNLQESVAPSVFGHCARGGSGPLDLVQSLHELTERLRAVLITFFRAAVSEEESRESSLLAALHLVGKLPDFRTRAHWNIFASLKDPAVWDAFILRNEPESRRETLARLDLIPEIDHAIKARNPDLYREFLAEYGFDHALDYQRRLIKRAYPGWRALLLHDIAHAFAWGGTCLDGKVAAPPTPYLPRVISEHAASEYQTDLHPESVIGDANFLEHPHRGITTGQTGTIGIGCIIYPCTLGGVTDKVKFRHPRIGNFVLIGTDVGIYGPVSVGEHSVIGANTEINGLVEIGENVRIRAAVVARTVISESGRPGKLIFEDGATVGEECLVINDRPSDLVIPKGMALPAHSYVVNDGEGRPKLV